MTSDAVGVRVQVHLVMGTQVYDVGHVTTHPKVWRAEMAELLRDLAAEIAGEAPEQSCPASG